MKRVKRVGWGIPVATNSMCNKSKVLIKSAVQQSPITQKSGMLERLFAHWFNGLVYNQIWEDPRVDMEALEIGPDSRIMTIGSGGCNVLNYLTCDPKTINVVDLNPCHMYLTRLKIAALQGLPTYEDFFNFFAIAKDSRNVDNYYKYVCSYLDDAARCFWEGGSKVRKTIMGSRISYFKKDFYRYSRSGYFIRFIHMVSKWVKANPSKVLEAQSMEEQEHLFEQYIEPAFDHWFVKWLGKLPMTVFSLGIPPQQFEVMRQENNSSIVDLFRGRVRRLACNFPIGENWFAWQAFGQRYDITRPEALPYYLRREYYEQLKNNVSCVNTYIGSITDFLQQQATGSLDCFVLLDSQDWMSDRQLEELWTEISRVGASGSRVIFRTAAAESPIETSITPALRQQFIYEKEKSAKFYERDRAAVYGGFHLYRMAT